MAEITDLVSGSMRRFLRERTRPENRAVLNGDKTEQELCKLIGEWVTATYQRLQELQAQNEDEEAMIKFIDNLLKDEEGMVLVESQMEIELHTVVGYYDDKNEKDRRRRQMKLGNAPADESSAPRKPRRIIDSDEEEENSPEDLDRKYNPVIHEIFQNMKVSQKNNNDSDILFIRDLQNIADDFKPSLDPETFHTWVTHKFQSLNAFAYLTPECLDRHFPLAEHVPADGGGPAPPGALLKKRKVHKVLSDSDASDGEPAQGGPKAPKEARAAVSAPMPFPEDMGVPMTIPAEVFGDTGDQVYKDLGYVPAPPPYN